MRLFGSMEVKNDELYIGGVSTRELSSEYGTPLYVFDEELIRSICRRYDKAFRSDNPENKVAYAGKAFLTIAMCELIKQEGMYLDVVSGGELYTAMKAGFPMERVYFHGNNKTLEEIALGVHLGVGRFVVDNLYEIEKLNELSAKENIKQKILLRITPGIEAHTHEYIKTGQIDSKFGFTILSDKIIEAVNYAIQYKNIDLVGFHCHIGSQIFELTPYRQALDVMLELIKDIEDKTQIKITELDMGGGFGIYYKNGDTPKKIEEFCDAILQEGRKKSEELKIELPSLTIEPGRSIIGNAGTTLYTIGSIKDIPDVKRYVAVDGGMSDNIRPALYNAEYECTLANKVYAPIDAMVTIAGKCCESGDILLKDIQLPKVESEDLLAVLSTGAYGYSMSSNYNKIPRAAVVFVKDGNSKLVCTRQTYEEIIEGELHLR